MCETVLTIDRFRWAYCQLAALAQLKVLTPNSIRTKLETLPETLDETYENILLSIDETEITRAVRALKWLAFSECPLTLDEIEDACIIELDSEVGVNEQDRAPPGSIAAMLASLVTV